MLRFEHKYYIPIEKLGQLRSMLRIFAQPDHYARQTGGEYTVRSIYFETPRFECYSKKVAGLKFRNKVRLRGYNKGGPESPVFLEIKKKVEEPLLKLRASGHYSEVKKLFEGGKIESFLVNGKHKKNHDNALKFMYNIHARKMRPVVTVIYEREPYEDKFGDEENHFRMTIDKNLRAVAYPTIEELYSESRPQKVLKGCFLLEVKFNRYLPGWARGILDTFSVKRESASKYVLSVDAHSAIDPTGRYDTFRFGKFW